MCGLAGFIGQNPEARKDLVHQMAKTIHHRGPDHQKVSVHQFSCVGFNRLAIVDLTPKGNQPFEWDGVIVYCNGEIYNHLDIKKKHQLLDICQSRSDIEMIPHLYRRFGLDFLHELNGMFSMVIIDERENKVFLISDRFGKKPLFYRQTSDGFYFASELKSFLLNTSCEVDEKHFNYGFFLSYLPYPLTPIKGIEKLSPGTVATISDQRISKRTWYVLKPDSAFAKLSMQEHEQRYKELLNDAVRIRMEADVESGFFLSGGLDSTSIAASAVEQGYQKLHAFCAVIDGKDHTTDNVNGLRFANDRGLNLHRINIDADVYDQNIVRSSWVFDEGNYESCGMNFMIIAREARKYLTILQDGTGGDEIFFGYPYQMVLNKVPKFLRGSLPYSQGLMNQFEKKFSPRYRSGLRALMDNDTWFFFERSFVPIDFMLLSPNFDSGELRDHLMSITRQYDSGFIHQKDLNRLSYLDILGFCMANFLRADRGSMAYSIEPRSPLSDYRLWEHFLSLPEEMKFGRPPGLKKYMRQISKFLPDYILNAKKEGFSNPVFGWFKANEKLRKAALNLIAKDSEFLAHQFGADLVETIVAPWRDNRTVQWMDGIRLHMLTTASLWNKIYVEKSIKESDYDGRLTELERTNAAKRVKNG